MKMILETCVCSVKNTLRAGRKGRGEVFLIEQGELLRSDFEANMMTTNFRVKNLQSMAAVAALLLMTAGVQAQQGQAATPPASQTPPPAPTTDTQKTDPQKTAPASLPDLPDAPGMSANVAPRIPPTGPTVVMDTSMGRITCKLFEKEAPLTVENFIGLAEGTKEWTDPATRKKIHGKPFYDGTTFHRVIPEFMVQGGDPIGDGTGDAGYYFNDEINPNLLFDVPGRLAMANAGPNTNGSQFFITEAPQPSLDLHYNLFGQCDDASVETVKAIARVPRNQSNDKPYTAVILRKVTIVRDGQAMPPDPAMANRSTQTPAGDDPKPGARKSDTPQR
jgi:peptidyl-prolyl cis-trans isomerase A (cyclophilin A)